MSYVKYVRNNVDEYVKENYTAETLKIENSTVIESDIFELCEELIQKDKSIRLPQLEKAFLVKKDLRDTIISFLDKKRDLISYFTHVAILLIAVDKEWFNDHEDWVIYTLMRLFSYPLKDVHEWTKDGFKKVHYKDFSSERSASLTKKNVFPKDIACLIYLNHLEIWQVNALIGESYFEKKDLLVEESKELLNEIKVFCKYYVYDTSKPNYLALFYSGSPFNLNKEFLKLN